MFPKNTTPSTARTRIIKIKAHRKYFLLNFFCNLFAPSSSVLASTRFLLVLIIYSEIIFKFYPCSSTMIAISFIIALTRTVACYTSFRSIFFSCNILRSISKSTPKFSSVSSESCLNRLYDEFSYCPLLLCVSFPRFFASEFPYDTFPYM